MPLLVHGGPGRAGAVKMGGLRLKHYGGRPYKGILRRSVPSPNNTNPAASDLKASPTCSANTLKN